MLRVRPAIYAKTFLFILPSFLRKMKKTLKLNINEISYALNVPNAISSNMDTFAAKFQLCVLVQFLSVFFASCFYQIHSGMSPY